MKNYAVWVRYQVRYKYCINVAISVGAKWTNVCMHHELYCPYVRHRVLLICRPLTGVTVTVTPSLPVCLQTPCFVFYPRVLTNPCRKRAKYLTLMSKCPLPLIRIYYRNLCQLDQARFAPHGNVRYMHRVMVRLWEIARSMY